MTDEISNSRLQELERHVGDLRVANAELTVSVDGLSTAVTSLQKTVEELSESVLHWFTSLLGDKH